MIAGHFALAAAIRSKQPEVPLWALMVSTQLLDILFIPLLLTGKETLVSIGSGGYGEAIIHADYTHSLFGALVISFIAGLIARRWLSRTGARVIAATVFSHWILDFIVHRTDMPLFPGNYGNFPLLGWGLWSSPLIAIGLEFLMIIIGSVMYFRFVITRTEGNKERQKKAFISGIVLTVLLFFSLVSSVIGA